MFRVQIWSNQQNLKYYIDDDTVDEFISMQTGELKDENYLIL